MVKKNEPPGTPDAPLVRDKPLSRRALRKLVDADDYIRVAVVLPFGQVACASSDNTYDGLNDIVDERILKDGCLSDISYAVIGFHPPTPTEPTGYVVVSVRAQVPEE